jgi:putative heme iron utilization protein
VDDQTAAHATARRDAKRLLRLSRTGALATLDGGAPLATLIGVVSDWDGAPLFLMSELSRHTRNLDADPRISLLLTTVGGGGDPLNQPRITLGGVVGLRQGQDGRARYVQRNPKAKLYIDFADFSLRRLDIETVHFNGGFGRAEALTVAELMTPGDPDALREAEPALLTKAAALGDAALAKLAGGGRRVWRPVGLDAEGLDLGAGGLAARVDFEAPVSDPQDWGAALERLAG